MPVQEKCPEVRRLHDAFPRTKKKRRFYVCANETCRERIPAPQEEKRMMERAIVIGAGLAGCEAAWQLAQRGVPVTLHEMKPHAFTPAHHSAGFAEVVCSNSLRSDQLTNAVGLLKEEMRQLGSLILKAADATRVPAGGALAVDREKKFFGLRDAGRAQPSADRGRPPRGGRAAADQRRHRHRAADQR